MDSSTGPWGGGPEPCDEHGAPDDRSHAQRPGPPVALLGCCGLAAGGLGGWLLPAAGAVWAAAAVWLLMGAWVTVTDLRSALIARRVVWPAAAAMAAMLCGASLSLGQFGRFAWALVGAASVGVVLTVLYVAFPGRFGYGDVRLITANGLLAGWWGLTPPWWCLAAGAVAAWPAAALALVHRGVTSQLRWAPWLVVGTAAVVGVLLWRAGPV
ncbi:MAG: A24 family peptidase [Spirochaetaceae bacterium]|nr:A24 family peptidase [Spirochaetaceae bacterium]